MPERHQVKTGLRVCVTRDGRHVLDTHPDAAILVYTATDVLPEEVERELFPEPETKPVRAATKPRRARTKQEG